MLKKTLLIFLFLLSFATASFAEKLHFVSIEGQGVQEVAHRVLPKILEQLNIDVHISRFPAKRAEENVKTGINDGEVMRIHEYGRNNTAVIRVPTPYYQMDTIVFVNKCKNLKVRSISDLRNHTTVKVRGVKHTNLVAKGLCNVYDIKNTRQMMIFLEHNRTDAALSNSINGLYVLKGLGFTDIMPAGKSLGTYNLYCYLHKKHAHLVPLIDAQIRKMKANGELDRLVREAEQEILGEYFHKLEAARAGDYKHSSE